MPVINLLGLLEFSGRHVIGHWAGQWIHVELLEGIHKIRFVIYDTNGTIVFHCPLREMRRTISSSAYASVCLSSAP